QHAKGHARGRAREAQLFRLCDDCVEALPGRILAREVERCIPARRLWAPFGIARRGDRGTTGVQKLKLSSAAELPAASFGIEVDGRALPEDDHIALRAKPRG